MFSELTMKRRTKSFKVLCIAFAVSISTLFIFNFRTFKVESIYADRQAISLHPSIENVVINIGTNDSPLKPKDFEPNTVIIAVEANVAIANHLRDNFQKRYPHRFFVINCAVSNPLRAGTLRQFRFYNRNGLSSSLSESALKTQWTNTSKHSPDGPYGPGSAGFDLVSVTTLDAILESIPSDLTILLLKTDTQGHDFSILTSASINQLHRVHRIITETYLPSAKNNYKNVRNDLVQDWIPYMKSVGFKLVNRHMAYRKRYEFDAEWVRNEITT